ncbi:hypothetical protein HKD37_13G036002 [Glycine soja]
MKKRKNPQIDPNLPFTSTLTRPPPFHAPPNSLTKDTGPKTSEFAFFKKLKKDASAGFRSRPMQKDSRLSSKKPESSGYSREKNGDIRVGIKGDTSSRIIEHVSTVRTDSFFSPSVEAWNKSGNLHVHGEVFARKRQKLQQCVADALFTDTEKLCSKGHDIISRLLSRLFPMGTEANKYVDTHPGKLGNATRYDFPDSQETDDQFKEHYQIPKRKLLELESSPYLSNDMPSPMFLRLDKRINLHSEFPTNHSHNFPPLYSITEPECKLSATPSFSATAKSGVTLESLFSKAANATRYGLHDSQELDVQFAEHHLIPKRKLLEHESSSSFSDHLLSPVFLQSVEIMNPHVDFPTYPLKFQPLFSMTEAKSNFGGIPSFIDKGYVTREFLSNNQEHEILALNHFKELGKLESESFPLMENFFDYTTDETSLPITCKYTKPNIAPELPILGYGEEQILNNTLDEYHVSPSSLLLDKPQVFNSILDSGFLRCQEFKFGNYVYEDMDTNFNPTALSLSHNKHYLNVSENYKNGISCVQDSVFLSPYQHWVGRTVSGAYHHRPNPETWLPSSPDECQRCLSLTSSHLNHQSSNSRTFQLPQRESMSSLFHINDNYKPEMDGENHSVMPYHFREGLIEMYNSSFLHMSMQRNSGCPFPLDGCNYVNEQEKTQKLFL